MIRKIMIMAAVAGLSVSSTFGQMIRLSDKAVVEPRQDVRLGNIATITGTDAKTAAALADTVVLPAVEGDKTVRAESVLMAVIAQLGAQNTATQLQLSGAASCEITVSDGTAKAPVVAAVAAVPATATTPVVVPAAPVASEAAAPMITASVVSGPVAEVSAAAAPQTLAQIVTERLQHELGVGAADLEVTFGAIDSQIDVPAPEGARWNCRPLTRTFVGTVMWNVEAVKQGRVVKQMTLETTVKRRVKVLTALEHISRGDPLTKGSYTIEDAWPDRDMPTLFSDEKDALGLAAQRDINPGEQLDKRDFKPMLLAQRGDSITVVFMSGALQVKMNAMARQDGKMHDSIEVENESTREKYQAILIGKKLAVVGGMLTDAQEKKLRETR